MLLTVPDVKAKIAAGKRLLLAGGELPLSLLPRGEWVGGTTPYFMSTRGGVCSESRIFTTEVPDFCGNIRICRYAREEVPAILEDSPSCGFSFLILPARSDVHSAYANFAASHPAAAGKTIVGWVSGVHVSLIGDQFPAVFAGTSLQGSGDAAVAMHVELPPEKIAEVEVINLFPRGRGEGIVFPASGFAARQCLVNGRAANFMSYILKAKPNPMAPLTACLDGYTANVSIQGVDAETGCVHFYAPVTAGVEYRFAEPVLDYVEAFERAAPAGGDAFFCCNCVLNYLYAGLEGKRLGALTGPITFGEIAYRILNQTLLRVVLRDREAPSDPKGR
jgi:hypothetical protein